MPAPMLVPQRQRSTPDLPTGNGDDDQALEVDALTPSINNYQPQVVTETLKRDAMLKEPMMGSRNQEMEMYHTETGFMESVHQK